MPVVEEAIKIPPNEVIETSWGYPDIILNDRKTT